MHTIVIVARHEIQKVHQALDLYVRTLQAASQHRMSFGLLSNKTKGTLVHERERLTLTLVCF